MRNLTTRDGPKIHCKDWVEGTPGRTRSLPIGSRSSGPEALRQTESI
jgi:hypothetical protein